MLSLQLWDALISGYAQECVIPSEIVKYIIAHTDIDFIKLNCAIHNQSGSEITAFVIQQHTSLRDMTIELENTIFDEEFVKDTNDTIDKKRIHFWLKFEHLRCIYPFQNQNRYATTLDIRLCKCKPNNDEWVELPNDFEDITVNNLKRMIKSNDFELGVEIFNEQTQQWPSRSTDDMYKFNLQPHDGIFPDGEYQFIESYEGRLLDSHSVQKRHGQVLHFAKPYVTLNANQIFIIKQQRNTKFYTIQCKRGGLYCYEQGLGTASELIQTVNLHNDCHLFEFVMEGIDEDGYKYFIRNKKSGRKLIARTIAYMSKDQKYTTVSSFYMRKVGKTNFGLDKENHLKCQKCNEYLYWINSLRIGDIIDVRKEAVYNRWFDKMVGEFKWYEAVVRHIEEYDNGFGDRKSFYVHYIGLNKKYDEEFEVGNFRRIAKRNTMTNGPFRAKRNRPNAYKVYGLKLKQ